MLEQKGFTFVEVLLTCLFFPIILVLIIGVLSIMARHKFPNVSQHDLFKVQFYQLLSRAQIIECSERLQFTQNLNHYEIVQDKDRIIKTPGYEILMNGIDNLYFENIDGYCSILYTYGEEEVEINIEKE